MSAATMNEMERLRRERDSAVDQVAYWRERAVAAEGRAQALAAHVGRLSDAAKRYYNATCGEPLVNIESPFKRKIDEANAAMVALESAIKSAPATSLARLIAEKQADILEQMLGVNDAGIERMMLELRRQAEDSDQ